MYRVRAATRDDLAGIREVDAAVVGDRHDEGVIGPAIEGGRVLVAEEQSVVLAYLRWDFFWDTIPLCLTVRVRPENQRRGIGRALYGLAEEDFRRRGLAFWLSSTEEANKRSLLFHDSLGFRRIGTLFGLGQDVGEIFLRKDLG
jgi:L-amino acid N-acyltransferase YncA